jgi:hypothetical protein
MRDTIHFSGLGGVGMSALAQVAAMDRKRCQPPFCKTAIGIDALPLKKEAGTFLSRTPI